MTATEDMTVREIVASDFRAAEVFQRHGIDFCCKGNRSVEDACRAGGISVEAILREVTEITAPPASSGLRFNSWNLATLVSYIQANHHAFVRRTIPVLRTHTQKVAKVHGDAHPELREVEHLFGLVADEMTSHMAKEEHILFPYIVALEQASAAKIQAPATPFGTVRNPIRMMEAEHESAGDAMARIRTLTSEYLIPAGACTTYRVCLQELEAFERDLHQHVHLENNILFPRALQLESETW
jgi:regulator of cell morphogenesis and NO signaling